ncbi:MAG TPA: hypothetical protein VF534_17650 [Paraburkholderia sp.]
MVKKITYLGLILAALSAAWVVLFARTPEQIYPREMFWVFYILVIPGAAQCWIFTDKTFWNAGWQDGIPISPIFEKKWSEHYLIIRGMCAQARKAKDASGLVESGKYGAPYNIPVTGSSVVILSKGIKIGRDLTHTLFALILYLIITSYVSNNSPLGLKGYIATSWPVALCSILIVQSILFVSALSAMYWIAATFVGFLRNEK